MKRHRSAVLSVLLVVSLMGASAQAQAVTQSQRDPRLEVLERTVRALNQERGLRSGGIGQIDVFDFVQGAPAYRLTQTAGAWWTNTALVERLGLTGDQKAKIERAFENHRQTIVSTTGLLEKEEAQLARLLEAEPLDRNAILIQTDRVIQARGEMERSNAAMTLEMREHLTRAQWLQLPRTSVNYAVTLPGGRGGRGTAPAPAPGPAPTPPPAPPPPGTGGRRGRGQ